MANVTLFAGFRSTFFESFTSSEAKILSQASPSSFTISTQNGSLVQLFEGDFTLNKKGRIKSGVITSFSVFVDNQIAWDISGISLDVTSYNGLFASSKQSAFDLLFGGADTFLGSKESDSLFSYAGDDFVDGDSGNDFIDSGLGADTVLGGAGDDILLGVDDEDILDGEEGSDQLDGGIGADLLTGGIDDDLFITRDGASPELTAVEFNDNQFPVTLFAGNGIDIITDFNSFDSISANDEIITPPFDSDFNSNPGDPVFLQGTWLEDNLASGINRGKFELDDEGADLFFFVVSPEFESAIQSQQDLSELDPSIFGSQLFVLLEASELLG